MNKGNRSADPRKRALRLLAREHFADYSSIYEEIHPTAQNRYQARDRARVRLRSRFPARYLELYAQEQAGPGTDIPADVRSKSWQRALGRLADLRAPTYRKLLAQFRAAGMSRPRAADRAMAALREANGDLFARLLTEECQLWLIAAELPAAEKGYPDLSVPHLQALHEEFSARGVSCALGNVSGQAVLRVSCRGTVGLDEALDSVGVALLCGRWWYCWPEAMPISLVAPVAPVAPAAQAIISELGLGDDGEHRTAGITSLTAGRMLRSARMSIADPPAGSPAR
ncbi:MAG: hypothetical protein ACRDOU_25280 [Streptosporangiaceae bacterium]